MWDWPILAGNSRDRRVEVRPFFFSSTPLSRALSCLPSGCPRPLPSVPCVCVCVPSTSVCTGPFIYRPNLCIPHFTAFPKLTPHRPTDQPQAAPNSTQSPLSKRYQNYRRLSKSSMILGIHYRFHKNSEVKEYVVLIVLRSGPPPPDPSQKIDILSLNSSNIFTRDD